MSVTNFEEECTRTEANLTSLADERRRKILAVLKQQETPLDRRDLAEEVTAIEQDDIPATVSEQAVDRVLLTLHHTHLPKLEDAGFIKYDEQRNLITPERAGESSKGVHLES